MKYDPTIMRKMLTLRKTDIEKGLEQETLLNPYKVH